MLMAESANMQVEYVKRTVLVTSALWEAFDRLPSWQNKQQAIRAAMLFYIRLSEDGQIKVLKMSQSPIARGEADHLLERLEEELKALTAGFVPDEPSPPQAQPRRRARPKG